MRRGEEYAALKERIGEGLLGLVEQHHPGLSDLVEYREVSTPLTTEELTGHPGGQIYGMPATPERIRNRWVPVRTEIPGLLLTGADVCSPGVAGALMGGAFAAGVVMGAKGLPEIFSAARSTAR
jgi:phytoene dehydrogenase-like protein